jgi:hypothetical protein
MAEVKNSFISSKMNKDLDDRLIPNNQYRDALNIEVGKSETNNIGVLQNVYGNVKITTETNPDLECIGVFTDNQNNRIFQFLTDYTDPDPNNITYPTSGTMKIVMMDLDVNPASYTVLVEGLFLNFAKNRQFRITGVNLVENLLFWTDNRNQPRKINVTNAFNNPATSLNPYYTTETQISVAKYSPIDPITMYRKVVTTADGISGADEVEVTSAAGIVPGMTLVTENITGADFCIVTEVIGTTVVFYKNLPSSIAGGTELTFLISTMTNKADVPEWPGDPAFLEDKYVRFSYRFKFDDNEYSLMAPFTQIAYIPKQKGYFIAGNETDAYRSTVLNWFENNVNNIELIVPFPDKVGNLTNSYKIQEVDILYKDSNSNAIKVFETVPISSINTPLNTNNNYYTQPYQSQKPYKTLPENETVRVYDKVPVRAKAQEVAGNRVIYGNYYDKYTSLSSINYNMSVQPKSPSGTNFIEYPNHNLKKNRNYQVGFVIADKFGRQSSVILSTVDLVSTNLGGDNYAKGSTVYSSYENALLFTDVRSWFGDALILYLNSPIDQPRFIPNGTPGLYAIPTSNSGFAITASTITDTTYTFTLDPPTVPAPAPNTIPLVGNIMRGFYTDYVTVTNVSPAPVAPYSGSYVITTDGRINDIYKYIPQGGSARDIKFAYEYNPIGWYSYKVVVKQQEQDYYNVYLPGMLNGYPKGQTSGSQVVYNTAGVASLENGVNTTQFPVSETGNTSHIVLINDNINKVPRDLNEVGPDQKQYRSSVQLYGRVENTKANVNIIGNTPLYSSQTTTITYNTTTAGQGSFALIKPGDGIQCVQANEPIPNTPPLGGTQPNPYRWPGDTVVVSNVVVGTTGTITLSSPCWVLNAAAPPNNDDYVNFTITRAENKQYFPTRKADTVIAIAAANEFNFLSSSVDNLSGTAGLNFYQLQNKPLIGRVSTVNKIGVIAAEMIPFLSVYETRPEQSLLELFWETATTGLISDLNTDVLTGFDGASGFGEFSYLQFENQDPNGTGLVEGAANSKYVSSEFYVIDQNGFPLPNTTVTILSITDGNNNSRLADFDIESTPGNPELYRLKITPSSRFVFNNNAVAAESYKFVFNVINLDDLAATTQLTVIGRLGNIAPEITTITTTYNITQSATSIVTLEANNGAFYDLTPTPPLPVVPPSITGLKWTIDSIVPSPYFAITPYGGVLSLIDPNTPIGVYTLDIKVEDAINTGNGDALLGTSPFCTLSSTITLTINVGDAPVPIWLRPNYTSQDVFSIGSCPSSSGSTYGVAYIGPKANPLSTYLPVAPGSSTYQFIENVEVKNALSYVPPVTLNPSSGLTQGEYRFNVKLTVNAVPICPGSPTTNSSNSRGEATIYLYKRIYTPSGINPWVLSTNGNNFGVPDPPTVLPYRIGPLNVSAFYDPDTGITYYGQPKSLTTSFTVEADSSISPDIYEYAVVIGLLGSYQGGFGGNGQTVTIYGNDANYSYPTTTIPFLPPVTNDYKYYTGVEEISITPPGATTGIPYDTQDATRGISYSSPTNPVASGTVTAGNISVSLTLASVNSQIVAGLKCDLTSTANPGFPFPGTITYVNPANPLQINLQLDYGWPYAGTTPLVNLGVATQGSNETIGVLYANTEEGTEIKRFFTDSSLTTRWTPPVANKWYNFLTEKSYNIYQSEFGPGDLKYSEFPFYCARINENGEVIEQLVPTPNVQTAWSGQNIANSASIPIENYSYNVLYNEPPVP